RGGRADEVPPHGVEVWTPPGAPVEEVSERRVLRGNDDAKKVSCGPVVVAICLVVGSTRERSTRARARFACGRAPSFWHFSADYKTRLHPPRREVIKSQTSRQPEVKSHRAVEVELFFYDSRLVFIF
ncbi:unnamed protein product, partial [Scytosiphon promiscuus]